MYVYKCTKCDNIIAKNGDVPKDFTFTVCNYCEAE